MSKRKRPETSGPSSRFLTENEMAVLNVIKSSEDMGMWARDVKNRTNLPDRTVTNALKKLLETKSIKEVVNVRNKARKHYVAAEFEPSTEVTGGAWYVNGSLDTGMIDDLKGKCCGIITKSKVATVEMIFAAIERAEAFPVKFSVEHIEEVMRSLILDNEVIQVKSTGTGEYASVPAGRVCYKCKSKSDGVATGGAMASIPCGICPQISFCTPDGIISPLTCSYYTKWLKF